MRLLATDCHKPSFGTKVIPFHFAQLSCVTCHEDVHKGQFAARMNAARCLRRTTGMPSLSLNKGLEGSFEIRPCSNALSFARLASCGRLRRLPQAAEHGADFDACSIHQCP